MSSGNSNVNLVALLFALICIAAFWLFGSGDNQSENLDPDLTTEIETKTQDPPPQGTDQQIRARRRSDLLSNAEDISAYVLKISKPGVGIPFIAYEVQKPLLPKARLLDFRELDGRLWFAGNTGLSYFDLDSERWYHLTKSEGLPGDTAYGIERFQNQLLLDICDWRDKDRLTNCNNTLFDGQQFSSSNLSMIKAQANGRSLPKPKNLKGSLTGVVTRANEQWVTVRGKHRGAGKGWENGGVMLSKANEVGQVEYGVGDGLATAYCNSITETRDGTLWVSHWNEESGLSYLPKGAKRWQTRAISSNGIELGGVSAHGKDHFVFVAQQGGLVIYDTISESAHLIKESDGLIGYIVTDVQFIGDNDIWVTSYGYGQGGQRAAGLMKFDYSDIKRFFDAQQ